MEKLTLIKKATAKTSRGKILWVTCCITNYDYRNVAQPPFTTSPFLYYFDNISTTVHHYQILILYRVDKTKANQNNLGKRGWKKVAVPSMSSK